MPDETKVREFLDLPGLESYDGAMKDYVDKANKTLTTAVNVLEASKLDISVQQNLTEESKALGRTNLGAASKTEFDDHTANKENPHEVTKAQVGLGNVDNTSDADKPVSTAQATAIADAISAIPQSDWDVNDELNPAFIKNRPFYDEGTIEDEILPYETRTAISHNADYTMCAYELESRIIFVHRKKYKVTINGIEYVCTAKTKSGATYIGNLGMLLPSVPASDEPFCISGNEIYLTGVSSADNTFGVKTFEENVKTIDTKYLPEHLQFGETGNTTITTVFPYEEREFSYETGEMGEFALYTDESFVPFEEGKIYHVTIDGIEYTCQSFYSDDLGGIVILGSIELLVKGIAPDELPFCSYSVTNDNESMFIFGFKSTSGGVHSFGIEVEETKIVKIDQKYLPDMGGDVILFDIGDEIGAEDGYEYYNVSCNYSIEEVLDILTEAANAPSLSSHPIIRLRQPFDGGNEYNIIPLDFYNRNNNLLQFFFTPFYGEYYNIIVVAYGISEGETIARAMMQSKDLDETFMRFPKKYIDGTPTEDYGVAGQVPVSTGANKVEWKDVSELIDEELNSKQNKTLIVTAKMGSSSDFWNGTSSGNLTDISHTWQQIEDAIANNAEVKMKVGFTDSDEMYIFTMSDDFRSEGCIIFHTINSENFTVYTVITQDGSGQWHKEGIATVSQVLEKQDKITGTEGQIVGFDENGNAIAQDMPDSTNPDWNQNDETAPDFIKNRPFYVGDETAIEIFPYQSVTFDSVGDNLCMFGGGAGTIEPFEVGKTYYVTIDGTEYTCIAKDGSEIEQDGLVYLGDSSVAIDGIAGEYPFMAYTMVYSGVYLLMVAYITSTTEHSIGISVVDREIIKIPEKYMPDLPTITNIIFNAEDIDEDSGTLTNISCNKTYDEIYKWHMNMLIKYANGKEIFSDNKETTVWLNIAGRLLRAHCIGLDGVPEFYFIDHSDPNMIVTTQFGIVYSGEDDLVGAKKTINLYEVAGAVAEASVRTKQDKITGTAGDFVVIGEDGNVTTKTIPYAEEATF